MYPFSYFEKEYKDYTKEDLVKQIYKIYTMVESIDEEDYYDECLDKLVDIGEVCEFGMIAYEKFVERRED